MRNAIQENLILTLAINGMTCRSCVGKVQRSLTAVSGVADAVRRLESKQRNHGYTRQLPGRDQSPVDTIAKVYWSFRYWRTTRNRSRSLFEKLPMYRREPLSGLWSVDNF